jgi:hypothetical protein
MVPFECEIDPKVTCMDELLANPKVMLAVTNDLARSAPQALWNGRPATPVEVTLRIAVARRLTPAPNRRCGVNWSLREALIRPRTLQRLHAQVVWLAQARGMTYGRQLRSDSTVIETDTRSDYPTDSRLLDDSVRVLGRTLARARRLLQPAAAHLGLFRNRHRQAHRLARQIAQRLRGKSGAKKLEKQAERLYRQLVQVTEMTVTQAEAVLARLQRRKSKPA